MYNNTCNITNNGYYSIVLPLSKEHCSQAKGFQSPSEQTLGNKANKKTMLEKQEENLNFGGMACIFQALEVPLNITLFSLIKFKILVIET